MFIPDFLVLPLVNPACVCFYYFHMHSQTVVALNQMSSHTSYIAACMAFELFQSELNFRILVVLEFNTVQIFLCGCFVASKVIQADCVLLTFFIIK